MDTLLRHLRRSVLRQEEVGWADGDLLASFIEFQDEAAFEVLVRRHGPMVFGVCRRVAGSHHDAEDAFQATFLVLARKAASIQPRERVANWLHGVAQRTALKARTLALKRRQRESLVMNLPEPRPARQDAWSDVQPLLDQELNGLPENYRLPILLCDLEGKTIREAMKQLGWPQGTVAGRLARGRKLLAKRLAKRGITLSAGALAEIVSQNSALSALPPALVTSMVKAGATLAVKRVAVIEVASAQVAILTEGVLRTMMLSKLKAVVVGILLLAGIGGAAGAIYQTQAAEQPALEKPAPPTATDPRTKIQHPRAIPASEYVIEVRLLEAGTDRPRELLRLPRATVDAGQPLAIHIEDRPENLLAQLMDQEKIKVGTYFDGRVKRLGGNKVRLYLSFQKNELEVSSLKEIRVLGASLHTIQEVELSKPAKVAYQKDAAGTAQRWLEIKVEERQSAESVTPPPAGVTQPAKHISQ